MKTICPYRDWHWTLATDSENPFSLNHLANGMIKRRRYLPVTFPLPDIRLKRKCQILPINKHAGLPKIERGQTVAKHGICKSQHIPLYVRSATTLAWLRWRPFALGQCNRWVVLHIENSVLKILYRFTYTITNTWMLAHSYERRISLRRCATTRVKYWNNHQQLTSSCGEESGRRSEMTFNRF